MQEKECIVKKCKELVEACQEQDRNLAVEVRLTYKEADAKVESERKIFRSGYEDRLQKVN